MLHIDKKGQNDEKDKDSSDIYNHNSNHFDCYSMFIHQALHELQKSHMQYGLNGI